MDTSKYLKEGQITNVATGTIIGLIIGIGLAVLVLIFVGTMSGSVYEIVEEDVDAIGTNVVVNQTFTASNSTAVSLGNADIHPSTLVILNSTTPFTNWGTGANWTIDYGTGDILLLGGNGNGASFYASYTWGNTSIMNSIRGSMYSGFVALETTADYIPIIVLTVIITLVLGMVFVFGGVGRSAGGGAL